MEYKHFTQMGNLYSSKRIGYFNLILAIFWGTLGLIVLYSGLQKGDILTDWYWIVAIIAALIPLRIYAQQITIDLSSKTIARSYFGLFKTRTNIDDIKNFYILKHVYLTFHNGTDISIIKNDNKQIKLYERIGKTKNVDSILNEFKEIITSR